MKTLQPFLVERGLPSRFVNQPGIAGDRGPECGLCVDGRGQMWLDAEKFAKLRERFEGDPLAGNILERASRDAGVPKELYPARYWHCGTHRVADIPALLHGGYEGYLQKISALMENANPIQQSFLRGMRYTAFALIEYFQRCSTAFLETYIKTGDRDYLMLGQILSRVPQKPCRTFQEAVVVIRLLNLFCDSEYGRIDQYLYPYYLEDVKKRRITRKEAKKMLQDLCYFADRDDLVWHQVIGGCDEQGAASYNEVTLLVLENAACYAHPHTTLRVRADMPEEIWHAAMQAIGSGCGNPALVREDIFINDLVKTYHVPLQDARNFAFGGCSEILIPGKTNVDSTWCAYNTAEILNETIFRELEGCQTFEEFMQRFREQTEITVEEMVRHVNIRQHLAGIFLADPVLSLHTAGCLESQKSFWEGGAVYNFDGADIFGNTNAVNSMVTIRALFEGRLSADKQRLIRALKEDFKNDPELLLEIQNLPKFGNGDAETGELAKEMTDWLFSCIIGKRTWRGGGYFVPDIIQWITYATLGEQMGATADGRRAQTALADSCSAAAGTDESGPTALLSDCALLPHEHGAGTMVLNLSLAPSCFTEDKIEKMPALFLGYFSMGGSQVQVNVTDKETLLDAYENPEAHRNLIVRVGGFTDYFYKQSKEIQRVIVDRTLHAL